MRGENRSTRGKTSHGRVENRTNKLNPHMTPGAEIEPGPHWWKASALSTRQTLLPGTHILYIIEVNIQNCFCPTLLTKEMGD